MNMNPTGLPQSAGAASPSDTRYIAKTFFCYELDFDTNNLAANGSVDSSFNISKDSDFFWTKFGAHAVISDDGTTISAEELPEVNILVVNSTTGRQYMSNPVPLANMSGSGRLPFILPIVTLWESLSNIQVSLQNVSDNKTYTAVRLSFLGIKAFLGPNR